MAIKTVCLGRVGLACGIHSQILLDIHMNQALRLVQL